jgi:NADP-dependent 3-hydroxy acid dehydrogenase YdfG
VPPDRLEIGGRWPIIYGWPVKTALVTGASGGIGAAVAKALAPTHVVWLGGRDASKLRALADELPDARPWPVDLLDLPSFAPATAAVEQVDVVVHCAGMIELVPLAHTSPELWRQTFELNVVAPAELTRVLLPKLRAARGHVVLINSGAGLRVQPNWGSYGASKFALKAYAEGLRAEEPDIRVTTVFPGRTDTEMQRGVRDAEGGDYQPEKYLKPETVAQAVLNVITMPEDGHPTDLILRPRATSG